MGMSATGERMIATKALRHKETRRFCRGEKSKGGYAEMIFGDGRHECTNRLMRINNSHLSKIKNKIRNSCIRGQAISYVVVLVRGTANHAVENLVQKKGP